MDDEEVVESLVHLVEDLDPADPKLIDKTQETVRQELDRSKRMYDE